GGRTGWAVVGGAVFVFRQKRAYEIRDSDTAPPARATGGSQLGLPPRPVPEARTRWRRMRWAPVPSKPRIRLPVADLSRPGFAPREASGSPRLGAAPAVADTRGSSTRHGAVSTSVTRRRCARSRSLRGQKNRARSGASSPVPRGGT